MTSSAGIENTSRPPARPGAAIWLRPRSRRPRRRRQRRLPRRHGHWRSRWLMSLCRHGLDRPLQRSSLHHAWFACRDHPPCVHMSAERMALIPRPPVNCDLAAAAGALPAHPPRCAAMRGRPLRPRQAGLVSNFAAGLLPQSSLPTDRRCGRSTATRAAGW